MASNNIARLGVVLGLDTAEFTASIDKAISENTKLKRAIQSDSNAAAKEITALKFATDDYGKTLSKVELIEREMASGRYKNATIDLQSKLRDQAAAYDAVAAAAQKAAQSERIAADIQSITHATEDYGKTLSRVQIMEREIATGKYRTAAPEQRQALLNAAAAHDAVAGSVKKVNAGLTEQQKLGISYQITDFVTQIGSGQNAMVALLQQGGQLKDQLGGFDNAFRLLKGVITPVGVALTAVAGTVGILGLAFYKGMQESEALRDSLILTGRYAGITQSGFQQLSDSLSTSFNYSIGKTKDILSALVSSGKFTSDSLGSVAQSIALVAKLSGESVTAVTQKLIPAFNGTASSAKSMNDQYHFLTLAQYKQIEALEKQGRAQEAIKLQSDAFNASIKDQERNLGYLETAWTALGNSISRAWDFLKGIGRTDGPEIALQNVVKQINALEEGGLAAAEKAASMRGDNSFVERFKTDLQQLYNQKDKLTAEIVSNTDKAKASQKETEKVNKYADAGGLSALTKLEDEIIKARLANKVSAAKVDSAEIYKIEMDGYQKIEEARREMQKTNREQNGQFASLQLELFNEKRITIERETAEKIKDINKKAAQESLEARYANLEAEKDFWNESQKSTALAYISSLDAIKLENISLDFAKQKLDTQNKLRLATEKELKIAMLNLETQEKIAKLKETVQFAMYSDSQKKGVIDEILNQQKLKESLIEVEDKYKRIGEMWDSVASNMTSALDNFVKTGKLNFKDFARSVIQDLIAIQLKAQATSLLRMAIGAFGSMSFGTGAGYGSQDFGGFLDSTSIATRAEGGPLDSGQLSMVGERGPELFVPRSAGTIVPNNALAGMGSTTNVTNNYISAIDVKSFEERLYGSSKAIWAANAYAAKGLATSSGRA